MTFSTSLKYQRNGFCIQCIKVIQAIALKVFFFSTTKIGQQMHTEFEK